MTTVRFSVLWAVLRLITAAAILAAIVGQLIRTAGRAIDGNEDVVLATANFFSFFTILSNMFAMVTLAVAAIWLLRRRASQDLTPPVLSVTLVAVSTYMIITGLVYNLLLRNVALPQGSTVPWSNEILHVWAPLMILADVFLAPRLRAVRWQALWAVVAFPIAWVVYTLIRGPLTPDPFNGAARWYPYPFLDPGTFANGYATVALYILGIAAAIVSIGAGVIWVWRRRAGVRTRLATSAVVAE